MRNKIIAIGAAAILVGGAVLYAVNQQPKESRVESLVMLQTFDNPQFVKGVKMMASSVAQALGKEDRSSQIGTDIRNHPEYDAMRIELVSGFGKAVQGANINDDELEQIITFFQSDAGSKWTVATGDPSVVEGFQSLFGLVQKVVNDYPDQESAREAATGDELIELQETEIVRPREAMHSTDKVQMVSESDFRSEVLESDLPVLVDLYADWCGPCKAMMPTLEEFASKFSGKIKVVKVNVDHSPSLVKEYEVSGVPTFLMFKDGKLKGKTSGRLSMAELEKETDRYLN